jgi:hypothetical protein
MRSGLTRLNIFIRSTDLGDMKMAIKNPIIDAQLTAFEKFFSLDHTLESENFEKYSIFSIANGRFGLSAKPDDLHLPTDDFGVDGAGLVIAGDLVHDAEDLEAAKRLHDIEIHLFQSKTSESLDYGDMSKFFDASMSIVSGEGTFPSSPELDSFIQLIRELFRNAAKFTANPILFLHYTVTGKGQPSQLLSKLINDTKDRVQGLSLFASVEIDCVGADALQQYYRLSTDAASATFPFRNRIAMPEEDGVKEAHIGYIAASDLVRMIAVNPEEPSVENLKVNRKLFFDNVRDYDPDSEINRAVLESIPRSPSSFVFRNNGITIVARDGRATGNNFYIEGFQIVNGCQTSNVVFEARSKLDQVNIPLRLIVSDDADLVNEVIVSTNRQNPVKEEQFWALRPFLKSFEEYVRNQPPPRTLFFERRNNQYRFDDSPERVRIIDASALLKSVVAMFLCLPNRAGRDFRLIKRDFDRTLFQPDHSVKPYHAAAHAYLRVEYLFRTKRLPSDYKIYRMFLIWLIGRSAGGDLSGQPLSSKSDKVSELILDLLDNETELVKVLQAFVSAFVDRLEAKGIPTRRDSLRSDDVLSLAKESAASLS